MIPETTESAKPAPKPKPRPKRKRTTRTKPKSKPAPALVPTPAPEPARMVAPKPRPRFGPNRGRPNREKAVIRRARKNQIAEMRVDIEDLQAAALLVRIDGKAELEALRRNLRLVGEQVDALLKAAE